MRPILHLDMDAFYAAVELLDHPELVGKPVVVGSPPNQRGVVSTASYEARKYGIHSAMPSRTAGKLCPHAVFLPVRMERYLDVSEQIMRILESFTPMIEQVSVDEAFLDVSGAMRKWKDPVRLAEAMKSTIREKLKLSSSVGVAPNKFLAKLASDLQKPDGLTVTPEAPDEIARFLAPLPIRKIWGIGKKTEDRLHSFGINKVEDIQKASDAFLDNLVGTAFRQHIRALAFGIDDRPVVTSYEAKSLSSEHTFDEDCTDPGVIRQTMIEMAEQAGRRLRRDGTKARVAHIKLRFEDFSTITRQMPLRPATHADRRLIAVALELLERELGHSMSTGRAKPPAEPSLGRSARLTGTVRPTSMRPVRLLGFGVSCFRDHEVGEKQLYLFQEMIGSEDRRDDKVDRAVDALRERFGESAIRRGG